MSNLDKKKVVVDEIKEKIEKSQSIVLLKYLGIDAEGETELRKHLTKNEVDYKVYKNTLIDRAIEGTKYEELKGELTGPTAVAFSYDDPTAAARSLYDIVKKYDAIEMKAGIVDGVLYDKVKIVEIAKIPGKMELISKLLGSMNSPIAAFARVIKQVAEKGE